MTCLQFGWGGRKPTQPISPSNPLKNKDGSPDDLTIGYSDWLQSAPPPRTIEMPDIELGD